MTNESETRRKIESLQQLSTEQLRELLRQDAVAEDGEDLEVIKEVLSILSTREDADNTEKPVDVERAWQTFQTQYNTPEGKGRSLYPTEGEQSHRKANRTFWHRAAVIAACVVLVFGLITPAATGHKNVFTMIGKWTKDAFQFFQPTDAPTETTVETVLPTPTIHPGLLQLDEEVHKHGVVIPIVPKWLPDGFELTDLKTITTPIRTTISAEFLNSENHTFVIAIDILGQASTNKYFKDDPDVESIEFNEIPHYLMGNDGFWTACWAVENVECVLSVQAEKDVLIHILKSIYTENP